MPLGTPLPVLLPICGSSVHKCPFKYLAFGIRYLLLRLYCLFTFDVYGFFCCGLGLLAQSYSSSVHAEEFGSVLLRAE